MQTEGRRERAGEGGTEAEEEVEGLWKERQGDAAEAGLPGSGIFASRCWLPLQQAADGRQHCKGGRERIVTGRSQQRGGAKGQL